MHPWMAVWLKKKPAVGVFGNKDRQHHHPPAKREMGERGAAELFCQLLHYLNVTGFDFAILKAQFKTEWQNESRLNVRHYYFDRRDFEPDIAFLQSAELEFWDHVINDREPNLILPAI